VSDTETPLLSQRFSDALLYAAHLHRHQVRKGTPIPYMSHLMSVAALVLEDGGSEDEAIAALLHDTLEDCATETSAEEIERRFGAVVRQIVEACTDTPPGYTGREKPPWEERKAHYLEHLRQSHVPYRVSLADKLHNARSILRDVQLIGPALWQRFSRPPDQTLWYYRSLVDVYRARGAAGYLIEELDHTVTELERSVR
jgi:(p)ppGpp synthase/HD superfamily hydrolase